MTSRAWYALGEEVHVCVCECGCGCGCTCSKKLQGVYEFQFTCKIAKTYSYFTCTTLHGLVVGFLFEGVQREGFRRQEAFPFFSP